MAQQTAVEWLQVNLANIDNKSLGKYMTLFKQAKVMEKEQIINAWRNGDNDSMYNSRQLDNDAEQYYNERYVK